MKLHGLLLMKGGTTSFEIALFS